MIAHKFITGWVVGVVKCVEKKKRVAGQLAVNHQTNVFLDSRTKLGRLRDRQVLGTIEHLVVVEKH